MNQPNSHAVLSWNFSTKSERDLLGGGVREVKTQELRSTLSVISNHVTSLIRAAENRARDGDSPSPTARGGLGMTLPTKSEARAAAAAQTTAAAQAAAKAAAAQTAAAQAIPATPAAIAALLAAAVPKTTFDPQEDTVGLVQPCPEGRTAASTPVISPTLVGAKASAFAVGAASVLPVDAESASPVGVPARTRVLRRVSSIRKLFLGATKTGEQLEHFAEQMGLPHDVVVTHFQVRTHEVVRRKRARAVDF